MNWRHEGNNLAFWPCRNSHPFLVGVLQDRLPISITLGALEDFVISIPFGLHRKLRDSHVRSTLRVAVTPLPSYDLLPEALPLNPWEGGRAWRAQLDDHDEGVYRLHSISRRSEGSTKLIFPNLLPFLSHDEHYEDATVFDPIVWWV